MKLPSDSDTTFKVKQGDFLVNVRVVTTGGKVYLLLPFTQPQVLTADQAQEVPDLSRLFDRERGFPAMLGSGRGSRLEGSEKMGNVDSYKVSTTYTADQVQSLLGALRPGGDVSATFWIGQSDKLVRKSVLSGAFDQNGGKATVEVLVHDFNKPVEITAPAA